MKYEIYDMIDEKYQYGLTLLRVHNKIKLRVLVKTLLILPIHNQIIINIIFLIINSMGTIVLCCDFNDEEEQEILLSKYLKILNPFGWVVKLNIDNTSYIIICTILMFLCIFRSLYILYIGIKINKVHITKIYNIKINPVINFANLFCIV